MVRRNYLLKDWLSEQSVGLKIFLNLKINSHNHNHNERKHYQSIPINGRKKQKQDD